MRPSHLFVSSTDGALYDTRVQNWHTLAPLRADYCRHFREIKTSAQLRATLRNGRAVWPGGYSVYFLTSDGAVLSFDAVRAELRQVLSAISDRRNDGWRVIACDVHEDTSETLICDHTGESI